jgi:hypothetical protein
VIQEIIEVPVSSISKAVTEVLKKYLTMSKLKSLRLILQFTQVLIPKIKDKIKPNRIK